MMTTGYWPVAVGIISWVLTVLLPPYALPPPVILFLTLALTALAVVGYVVLTIALCKLLPDFEVPSPVEGILQDIERRPTRSGILASVTVLVPVATAVVLFFVLGCTRCVAVLPFSYEGADESYSYLSRGLPDELIAILSRLPSMQVLSSTVTFDPNLAGLDLKTIGQRLGVAYVVEGRVSVERGEVRIRVKLVRARTGKPTWSSDKYQETLASVFELYDKVATEIATELRVAISPGFKPDPGVLKTTNDDVNDLYFRGRDQLGRIAKGDNLKDASSYFERATELDPHFARAHAGLCEAKVAEYRTTRDNAFIEPAKAACRRALELDPDAIEVHVARAKLYTELGELSSADEAISTALKINPTYYEAQLRLGELRLHQQRLDEAETAYQTAIELQPQNWMAHTAYGGLLVTARADYKGAEREFLEVLKWAPNNTVALSNLGACYMFEGRLQEAVSTYERMLPFQPNGLSLSNLGLAYYYLGRYGDSVRILMRATQLVPNDHRVWGNLAIAQSYDPASMVHAKESYGRAIALAHERLDVDRDDFDALADMATYYAATGNSDEAHHAIERAISIEAEDGYIRYLAGIVHELLGERSLALDEIAKALEAHQPRSFIEGDARLQELTGSAEYSKLLAEIGRST